MKRKGVSSAGVQTSFVGGRSMVWRMLWMLWSLATALAQESPKYTELPYNPNVSYRNKVCDRINGVHSGQIELRNAIEGIELTVLLRPGSQFHLTESGTIDENEPGLVPDLLDELARRAGFTWRNSFGIVYGPGENHTWTDLVFGAIETYDALVDYVDHTPSRYAAGISFPTGYYDSSMILVAEVYEPSVVSNNEVRYFSWLQPYDDWVWLLIVLTVIYSALVYMFLEYLNDEQDDRDMWTWVGDNLYLSSLLFTQNFEYQPKSAASRVFAVSMAIWALLMSATYTANLANFFVDTGAITRPINSMADVVENQVSLCVWENTNAHMYIQNTYPSAILVPIPVEEDVIRGIARGQCEFALSDVSAWDRLSIDSTVNGECNLERVGDIIKAQPSGTAMKSDAGFYCTSLIRDVLNLYMVELQQEGFVQRIWSNHLNLNSNQANCDLLDANSEASTETAALNLRHLAGSFVLHAVLSICAVVLSIVSYIQNRFAKSGSPPQGKALTSCGDTKNDFASPPATYGDYDGVPVEEQDTRNFEHESNENDQWHSDDDSDFDDEYEFYDGDEDSYFSSSEMVDAEEVMTLLTNTRSELERKMNIILTLVKTIQQQRRKQQMQERQQLTPGGQQRNSQAEDWNESDQEESVVWTAAEIEDLFDLGHEVDLSRWLQDKGVVNQRR